MIVGGVRLVPMLLFLLAAALLASGRPAWRPVGLLAALTSIAVLLPSAAVAWAGLVARGTRDHSPGSRGGSQRPT